jgi:hypothetical protein
MKLPFVRESVSRDIPSHLKRSGPREKSPPPPHLITKNSLYIHTVKQKHKLSEIISVSSNVG